MGKITSALQYTGRLGNTVGYAYLNKNNVKAQGVRILTADVKNPQSDGQAKQRARLKPINNFYRQLKAVIDRGYQEVNYGQPSIRLFRKVNMKDFQGPWLPKGTYVPVPGPFVISQGSLVPIKVTSVDASQAVTDLTIGETVGTTIGAVSTALMENNTDIQSGDQLTFISVAKVNNQADNFVYRWASIVIDPSSADVLPLTLAGSGADGSLAFGVGVRNDETLAAAAVIQSRDGGGTSHLRSFSQLAVNQTLLAAYFGADAMDAAIVSYQDAQGTNDWPTEQLGGATGSATTPVTIGGTTYYGFGRIGSTNYYGLVDGNGTVHHVRNEYERATAYLKYLGATTWISAPDPAPAGTVVISDDDWNTFASYAIRVGGYTVEGMYDY